VAAGYLWALGEISSPRPLRPANSAELFVLHRDATQYAIFDAIQQGLDALSA